MLQLPPAALTIIESPYAGAVAANLIYARHAMRDCFNRGEVPFASHLLYTQHGVLNDLIPPERELGIEAGLSFYRWAMLCAVYADHGISSGMTKGIERARAYNVPVTYRYLFTVPGAVIERSSARDRENDCVS